MQKKDTKKRYDNIWFEETNGMKKLHSCGVLLFNEKKEFLILHKFPQGRDLPKGHLEKGETLIEAAKRELREETGISDDFIINDEFLFENIYYSKYKRFGGETVEKKVTLFLGKLLKDQPIILSEHYKYEWIRYDSELNFSEPSLISVLKKIKEFEKEGKLEKFLN